MARSRFVKACFTTEVTDYTERHGHELSWRMLPCLTMFSLRLWCFLLSKGA